ncbi:hypothetical protein [Cytobacillus firmus]|uniref:hypothetical protein n=1 Tax=Cytobacillus firmus TaxID=1399 RepID=UPI001C97C837|nr:hypothetical protein [Cytobacillus firmus]MBY6051911.1 hypothetical protein [Cytobacillus firmus]URT71816.1 hypothetical protein NAF01_04950 [Cytobacillus firmus]
MFGYDDFMKFMQAFFVVFPIVTLIHLLGHIFFAAIFGGKGIRVIIGTGKILFSMRFLEVRRFYFWYGGCEYTSLTYSNKLTKSLIFLGGSILNIASIFLVNYLIRIGILDANMLWYQFVYFSFYYVFFALLPMDMADGTLSDGKAMYKLWVDKNEDDSSADCQLVDEKK